MDNRLMLTSWTIRKKLLLLILAVVLPASVIIVVFGLTHRGQAIREAEHKALLAVQGMAAQQEQVARGTEQMLGILAQLPEVQRLDAKVCNELFRELQIRHPFYSIISVVTPDGSMFAASAQFPAGRVNLSDRKQVKDAIKTLDFSAGEYIVGRVSKVQSINYAYPVLDANKNLIAILTAGFKLDEYARFVTQVDLPEGFAVVITDHAGVRLYRFPENDATAVGKPIPRDSFKRVSGDSEQGIFERIAEDKNNRVYGFKQLRIRENLPPYLYMLVGIPKDKILHNADIELLIGLSFLGIAAGIAISLAWVLGNLTLIRPINHLVTATRRLGKGEMRARTGLSHTPDELGQLAESFDDMAALLEMRNVERKQAEEKVARQNQFMNTILESLTHPFYVFDARDYTIKMANTAAAPDGLAPGTTCHTLTHGEDRPCAGADHLCPLETIKRTKQPVITEHIHIDKEGNPRHVEVHGYPILDINGSVCQIIEYNLDITERKQMEQALRTARDDLEIRVDKRTAELASAVEALRAEIAERKKIEAALRLDEYRLEGLVELSQMREASVKKIAEYVLEQQVRLTRSEIGAISFMDEDDTVFTVNAWSKEIRKQGAIMDDKNGLIRISFEKARLWAGAVREGKPMIINDFPASDLGCEECPVELSRMISVPLFEGDQIVVVALLANKEEEYDSADLRQLTLLLDGMWKLIQRGRAEKALRESESLAAMGKALSSVAHDMKTPLIAIGGFARQVRNHIEEENPDWNKLDIVLRETGRLENMVKDMLFFSRPLELDRAMEDINRVIEESLVVLESTATERKVRIEVEPAQDTSLVPLDPMRMKQVIINLTVNAIQASPEGEKVTVSTHCKRGTLIIEIADRGSGIPLDKREEIFLPFVSTKKDGTGLGLPIVKKIVEAHQGRIEILDNPDKGVTFRVTIHKLKEQ